MYKADIAVGGIYWAKIGGKLTKVRIDCPCPYGGWFGTNLGTNREVRIKSAAKLHYPVRGQANV